MKGIIVQFRRSRKRIHERHYLLDLGLASREEAQKMAGKAVEWKSPGGKVIKGKISDAHGNKGLVRAIFEKGLPGQAITNEIEVSGTDKKEKNERSN
ncbi:MAG: 50S ribosomal protein L35ae [Nanoarchaeota archaeon]|nr:50S ribosomal protein L35ae [Nanoarchaeota archaeon]MBU1103725.1 50S ribosomal protein L35ae [Nanoarchaeota archaeon]